ncbi:hypothetical protein [Micromonospora sp. NPDC050200]
MRVSKGQWVTDATVIGLVGGTGGFAPPTCTSDCSTTRS